LSGQEPLPTLAALAAHHRPADLAGPAEGAAPPGNTRHLRVVPAAEASL